MTPRPTIPERARASAASFKKLGVSRAAALNLIATHLMRDGVDRRVAERQAARATTALYLPDAARGART